MRCKAYFNHFSMIKFIVGNSDKCVAYECCEVCAAIATF